MSRLDPYWPFMQLRREISQLLDGLDVGNGGKVSSEFPPVNIWEDNDSFYAEAEIPGVPRESLEVFTIGDELTMRGKREPMQGKGLTYHRRERGMGEFERVVALPAEVNAEKVEARLHDGLLTIVMPKAEAAKAKKITVSAG